MYIYKITCLINNKVYIGQCSKLPERTRSYYGSGIIIMMVIKEYGKKNFIKEILRVCKDQIELDRWEMIYITKYKSCNEKFGYNILKGTANNFGSGSPMLNPIISSKVAMKRKQFYETEKGKLNLIKSKEKHKDWYNSIDGVEFKKRLSELRKSKYSGKNHPMLGVKITDDNKKGFLGKHHSEETKQLLIKIGKDKNIGGQNNSFFGKHHTKESLEKMRKGNRNYPQNRKSRIF